MPAIPSHNTATDDGPWDGPAQEKKLKTPLTTKIGNDAFAWVDPDKDKTTKTAWRFIHHFVAGSGDPGSASTLACSTGIGVLNGARTGTTIPDADKQGVWAHLASHLISAGVAKEDLPELKAAPALAIRDSMRGIQESRVAIGPGFELREIPNGAGGSNLRFTGFVSVTGQAYEMEDAFGPFVECVTPGAFRNTLQSNADVAFLLEHSGMPLARTKAGTMRLSEETDPRTSPVLGTTGLHVEALLDPKNVYVAAARSAIERETMTR